MNILNLLIILLLYLSRNIKKSTKSNPSKRTTLTGNVKSNSPKLSPLKVPRDAAVHFGNFYGITENTIRKTNNGDHGVKNVDLKASTKSEFTRQMFHKLERSAGTEEYARQVSALLEETVEPANFRVNPLPSENSIPDGRQNPTGYPLWYKDPYKMPITAKREYQLLKEKYAKMSINSNVQSENYKEEFSTSEDEIDVNFEITEEDKRNTAESLTNRSFNHSSIDENSTKSSVSYDENDDENHSTILLSDEEDENENEDKDYENVDTALSVR
ncbi:PREDICTED: uncharacterized protein LOC107069267 [Polistes dominula]|uniref:Uncharacterized protein LOC107069267 n=1 Tax=Polistes dominula TaxID=743375 RepID=A0ABM1INY5_POLDO|nr:PREDICTED: uncharacterized protein LOC107069267 [Polistes dominula]